MVSFPALKGATKSTAELGRGHVQCKDAHTDLRTAVWMEHEYVCVCGGGFKFSVVTHQTVCYALQVLAYQEVSGPRQS